MDARYRLGHRPGRRRRTRVLIVLSISVLIIGAIVAVVVLDIRKSHGKSVAGTSRTVVQAFDENVDKFRIDQPTFSMELPSDWKEIARKNADTEHSISWQAGKKGQENRYLKVYIDTIPASRAVNRLVPVVAVGSTITTNDVSENCATFTKGGTLDVRQAERLPDTPAKFRTVDFLCDLSRVIDNEVGTGSIEGSNIVTVKGPLQGAHKYFFIYTDRNVQPDYPIFYNALKSFRAK